MSPSRERIVASTPKGGCPLKLRMSTANKRNSSVGSIHPQGWVPVETGAIVGVDVERALFRSIHPQGWVPVETSEIERHIHYDYNELVAFTPKGGCPLKHDRFHLADDSAAGVGSIHPQGWVPVETPSDPDGRCSVHRFV